MVFDYSEQTTQDLTIKVVKLAKEAGNFILAQRLNFNPAKIESKGYNNLVSYVDQETEKILVNGLTTLLPEAGFITEEGTASIGKKKINWVIDPLDGTSNFLHNFPMYAVNVALMGDNEVFVAVTYDITRDECFYAWKNGGAWCNRQKLSTSTNVSITKALIAQGFPYKMGEYEESYFQILKKLNNTCHGFRHTGTAALDLAYVAAGRLDSYFEFNVFQWDIIPGILLVKEAGGFVTDFSGGDGFWDASQIVASGNVHAEMVSFLKNNFFI